MTMIPTAELVTTYWIKGVPGVPADLVAGTVPARTPEFAQSGFIQVQSGGGTRDFETYMRSSQVLIGAWAYNANSQKVPWGKANQLLELVLAGTEDAARRVALPAAYADARVR